MSQCFDCQFLMDWHRIERRAMKKMLLALLLAASFLPASQAADKPSETPPPKIKVGDMAPDFTLQDQKGNKVSLHDFKGKKNVALAFYIFAFTGG
jgi:cytochrome oxidase Cu insertion factor (SCO1/SenC/PrrC family)